MDSNLLPRTKGQHHNTELKRLITQSLIRQGVRFGQQMGLMAQYMHEGVVSRNIVLNSAILESSKVLWNKTETLFNPFPHNDTF